MKRTTATVLPFILLALSSVAASDQPHGSWKDMNIVGITAYPVGGTDGKGYVVVTFAANGAGTPSCASGYPRNVAIDLSTAGGAFAASIAQAAKLTGTSVTVTGTGTCTVTSTTETLASIQSQESGGPGLTSHNGPPPAAGAHEPAARN
jgi:hypothetical protein